MRDPSVKTFTRRRVAAFQESMLYHCPINQYEISDE